MVIIWINMRIAVIVQRFSILISFFVVGLNIKYAIVTNLSQFEYYDIYNYPL